MPLGHRFTGEQTTLSLTPSPFQAALKTPVQKYIDWRVYITGRSTVPRTLGRVLVAPVQERHDRIHNTAGHQRLGAVLQRRLGAVGGQQPAVFVVHLEGFALADSIDHQQVASLAPQLGPSMKQHVTVCRLSIKQRSYSLQDLIRDGDRERKLECICSEIIVPFRQESWIQTADEHIVVPAVHRP